MGVLLWISCFYIVSGSISLTQRVGVSNPSEEESETLGIRKWQEEVKSGSFTEIVLEEEKLTRYIQQGSGMIEIKSNDEMEILVIQSGMLLEVEGKASLSWTANGNVIVKTPSNQECKNSSNKRNTYHVLLLLFFGAWIAA